MATSAICADSSEDRRGCWRRCGTAGTAPAQSWMMATMIDGIVTQNLVLDHIGEPAQVDGRAGRRPTTGDTPSTCVLCVSASRSGAGSARTSPRWRRCATQVGELRRGSWPVAGARRRRAAAIERAASASASRCCDVAAAVGPWVRPRARARASLALPSLK